MGDERLDRLTPRLGEDVVVVAQKATSDESTVAVAVEVYSLDEEPVRIERLIDARRATAECGVDDCKLTTNTTNYLGAIFAVDVAHGRGIPAFRLVVKHHLVEQQVLWLRTGEGTGQDKQGSQIKAPHLRGLAEYVQRVLDAGSRPEDRTMEYIDSAGDRHASYFATLELRAQELIRDL